MICFALSRNDIPLYDYELNAPVDTGLRYSREFVAIRALLLCNASLSDVKDFYERGSLDDDFMKFVIRYYYADTAYKSHAHDAIELERMRRIEAERAKAK